MLKILNMVRDVKIKLKVCQDVEGLKKMGKFINMEKTIVDDIMNRALFINIFIAYNNCERKKC